MGGRWLSRRALGETRFPGRGPTLMAESRVSDPGRSRAAAHEPSAAVAWRLAASAAGGLVVPVLTALLAFLIGGVVVAATGHNPLLAYRDIFKGTGLSGSSHPTRPGRQRRLQPHADAAADDDADPHRPRGGVRVPLRHVQHRRAGPVLRRSLCAANWVGHDLAGMATCRTSCSRSGRRRSPAPSGRASRAS